MPTKRPTTEKKTRVRRSRFSSSTKGIRLTPELDEWANDQLAKNVEETFATLVRDGLRLLKKQREGLIQVLSRVDR